MQIAVGQFRKLTEEQVAFSVQVEAKYGIGLGHLEGSVSLEHHDGEDQS